jgi:hypothetical protein
MHVEITLCRYGNRHFREQSNHVLNLRMNGTIPLPSHTPSPSRADVKNEWNYTSSYSYAFTVTCWLLALRMNGTIPLLSHTPSPSRAGVKNEWNYTSTFSYAFTKVNGDDFALYIWNYRVSHSLSNPEFL